MWSKRFCITLALFFLVCFSLLGQSSRSPADMTETEIIQELMDNLTKREALIVEREKSIETREENLIERESILTQRKQLLTETEAYWKSYKKEALKDKIVAFGVGFGAGFLLGGYSGFQLGVTIRY